jgi:hypothetical protein
MSVRWSKVLAVYKNILIASLKINMPYKDTDTVSEFEKYAFIQINDVSEEKRIDFFPINLGHTIVSYYTDSYTFLSDIDDIEFGKNKIYFNGFFYSNIMDSKYQSGENIHTIFLYDKKTAQLTKKIILEGSGVGRLHDLSIKKSTIYVARVGNIGFSIDINTGAVLKVYHCPYPSSNGYSYPDFVSWGNDEIIYTHTISLGK